MSRTPGAFKQADVTRALRAAKKAGVDVQITLDLQHKTMTLTPVKVGEVNCDGSNNPWDGVLDNATDEKRAS
jgi:hypothetical protein